MTRAETLLWRYIKAHRIDGLGFRRQVPMGPYIVDFACHSSRIVVEIDGESHDFEERQLKDATRDEALGAQGYRVLRFTNDDVMASLEGVVEKIREAVRMAPPSLALPLKGGGNGAPSVASDDDNRELL